GFHTPYYIKENGRIKTFDCFEKAIGFVKGEKLLDITAVAQILNKGYAYGDRTLVKGLSKSPWMAKPTSDNKDWVFYDVPNHFEKQLVQSEIANKLFFLLKQEMLDYIENKKSIGVLLTGGIDSRI